MTQEAGNPIPTKLARRRLLVGRLVAAVLFSNLLLALVGGYLLNGPAAGLSRFRLGFAGWAAALFAASLVLTAVLVGPLAAKLLRPPAGD
ncbi:MAG: hypothetical protein HYY66_04250 [Candidatus Tectomicrobia bacterium]|nr:hypothetical protein [Candidatus Tectomicrobia bacterium]